MEKGKRCGAALLTLREAPSVPAFTCVVGLIICRPESRLMDPVRTLVTVVAVGIGAAAVADGARVDVGASGRDRVRTLVTQEED